MTDFDRPIEGLARRGKHTVVRDTATRLPHATFLQPGAEPTLQTETNGDETTFAHEGRASSFTKGLKHDADGLVVEGYETFVKEINRPDATDFSAADPQDPSSSPPFPDYATKIDNPGGEPQAPVWRGWESPPRGTLP